MSCADEFQIIYALREGHGNPLQYSCLENPHGQKSLAVHGVIESDTNEQLSTHMCVCAHTHTQVYDTYL